MTITKKTKTKQNAQFAPGSEFIEAIRKTIERYELIPSGTNLIAGVSGGADSVALLRTFDALGLPLTIAHLNHQLRGAESDADEAFVRKLADELELPLVVKSADVKKRAASSNLSIEMAARQARHEFFAEFDNATIALAHHADDQVETFLLKLARGAGTEGLGGMSYCQQIGTLRLIRPMLDIRRAEILDWMRENGFDWREDTSNADATFRRNRVRHSILPILERELNPNIRQTILRTMDILRGENEWMDGMLADLSLATDGPMGARRRLVRNWLFEHGATEVEFDAVDKILELMDQGNGSKVYELNDRQRVVVEYGLPRFEDAMTPSVTPSWSLSIEAGTGWRKDHGQGVGRIPAEASFDAEKVGDSPIEVRTFLSGDHMEPLGMDGSRKLQDIFTDQKVPRAQRSRIPVVVCRGEIIWLPGYRISRNWAVGGDEEKSLHIRIQQNPDA